VGRGTFVAGQLSWVGPRYALRDPKGNDFRTLVVPKQTGRGGDGHSHVTHAGRAAQVNGAKYGNIGTHRTHHMAGTEAALEVLLDADAGSRHIVLASGERVHVFDCFAMVNATRCSRVTEKGVDGEGSRVMYDECLSHLAAAIEILEPTVIVCEGRSGARSPAGSIRALMRQPDSADHLYRIDRDGRQVTVVELSHPSRNWVSYQDPRFLRDVRPLLLRARLEQ
jgi:hypothetical protein